MRAPVLEETTTVRVAREAFGGDGGEEATRK
jgi:hypothetical protein